MERARLDCVARPARAGLLRATSWSLRGLCLASALALPSGCGEDEASAPVLDADRLGDLSGAQLKSLCEEGEALQDSQGPDRCDSEPSYAVITAQVASCDESLPAPCDVTAGELRACRRAALADPCNERPAETAAACAPLIQRGCAEEDPPARVADCPDLAASVAPFEGIYEITRHTRNDAGCDAEGASVIDADMQPFFVVVTLQLFGAPIGWLESCGDLEDCRVAAGELRQYSQRVAASDLPEVPELSQSFVCHPVLGDALESSSVRVGGSTDSDVCSVDQTTGTLTRAEDGSLRLESQKVAWETPEQGDGCSFASGDAVPEGTPCSGLEVYEARLVSAP